MRDPLTRFNWSSLYADYDRQCQTFKAASPFLECFGPHPPSTDRGLYYQLVNLYADADERSRTRDAVSVYEALLYWKLYSQPAAVSNIHRWLRADNSVRNRAREQLGRLFQQIPNFVERTAPTVLELVDWLEDFQLPGMASPGALPVRTTFLHFMYPEVVPIFDMMVLKAVGAWARNANHDVAVLREYLPFAWELTARYSDALAEFSNETPVRAMDMALWLSRGSES